MATPLAQVLRAHGFRVTFLADRAFAGILPPEAADDVIETDSSLAGTMRTLAAAIGRFDVALDLHGTARTALLARAAAVERLGPGKTLRRLAYTTLLSPPSPGRHTLLRNLDILPVLGIPIPDPPPRPVVRQTPPPRLPKDPFVVLHPGARFPHKIWPIDHFASLGSRLAARGLDLVILEGPLDGAPVAELSARLPRAEVARGLTPPQTAGLIARARAFVGNDSGPMHLAAAVGIPLLALFGPSDDALWGPWSDGAAVLRRPCACGYGSRPPCRSSEFCMNGISVAEAEERLTTLLA